MVLIKGLVLVFTTLSAFLAISVIAINATALGDTDNEEKPFLYSFMAVASVTILICIFGLFVVLKEHIRATWAYAITQLALLVAMIALMYVYTMHNGKKDSPEKTLNEAFKQQRDGIDAMAEYQERYECCGILGAGDYTDMKFPVSCTNKETGTAKPGCLAKMQSAAEEDWGAPRLISWILMVVQIASFVFTTIFGVKLNNSARRARY